METIETRSIVLARQGVYAIIILALLFLNSKLSLLVIAPQESLTPEGRVYV